MYSTDYFAEARRLAEANSLFPIAVLIRYEVIHAWFEGNARYPVTREWTAANPAVRPGNDLVGEIAWRLKHGVPYPR